MKRKNIILIIAVILMFEFLSLYNVRGQNAAYQPVELVRTFGKGQFGSINNICISSKNIIYVSDAGERIVKAFNMQGEFLFSFGGNYGSKLQSIMELSSDKDGNVYAADYNQNLVNVYDPNGKYLYNIKLETEMQKKLKSRGASGMAINSRGDIYITDSANGRIEVRNNKREYKFQIDKFKSKKGEALELVSPTHPRINSHDELYIIDPLISRVHRFDAEGNYLSSFGYMGNGAGGFNAPSGLVVDKYDRIYVIDLAYEIVQVFDREGNFLYVLSNERSEKLYMLYPTGFAVDNDNNIYVGCNEGGWGVKVFKYIVPVSERNKDSR